MIMELSCLFLESPNLSMLWNGQPMVISQNLWTMGRHKIQAQTCLPVYFWRTSYDFEHQTMPVRDFYTDYAFQLHKNIWLCRWCSILSFAFYWCSIPCFYLRLTETAIFIFGKRCFCLRPITCQMVAKKGRDMKRTTNLRTTQTSKLWLQV